MKINCLFCRESYVCIIDNTKIVGPVIETECPICGKKLIKNLSSFIEAQVNSNVSAIQRAVTMQKYKRLLLSEFSVN
jgi:hypothetical protein